MRACSPAWNEWLISPYGRWAWARRCYLASPRPTPQALAVSDCPNVLHRSECSQWCRAGGHTSQLLDERPDRLGGRPRLPPIPRWMPVPLHLPVPPAHMLAALARQIERTQAPVPGAAAGRSGAGAEPRSNAAFAAGCGLPAHYLHAPVGASRARVNSLLRELLTTALMSTRCPHDALQRTKI